MEKEDKKKEKIQQEKTSEPLAQPSRTKSKVVTSEDKQKAKSKDMSEPRQKSRDTSPDMKKGAKKLSEATPEKKPKKEGLLKEIPIPEGVAVTRDGANIVVKGPKGELSREIPIMDVEITKDKVVLSSKSNKKRMKALIGTFNSHIKNMILGVSVGFQYTMKIFYTHFPINITVKDSDIQIKNFLGEKTLRIANVSGEVSITVEKDDIKVSGINREDVGQTCANIEKATKLSKRDNRVFSDGIFTTGKFLQDGKKV